MLILSKKSLKCQNQKIYTIIVSLLVNESTFTATFITQNEYHMRRKVAVFVRIRVRNDDVLEALFLKE